MNDATDRVEPTEAAATAVTRERRRWHAPQFMVTQQVALTESMSGGEADPGSFGS